MLGVKNFTGYTDTGANAQASWGVRGKLVQMSYSPGDTGEILDTGAELTLQMDTGGQPFTIMVAHMAPATGFIRGLKIPQLDTGGSLIATGVEEHPHIMGKLTASVQSDVTTDTGKLVGLKFYVDDLV